MRNPAGVVRPSSCPPGSRLMTHTHFWISLRTHRPSFTLSWVLFMNQAIHQEPRSHKWGIAPLSACLMGKRRSQCIKRETSNTTWINFDFVQKGTMRFPTCPQKHISFPHKKQQRHQEARQSRAHGRHSLCPTFFCSSLAFTNRDLTGMCWVNGSVLLIASLGCFSEGACLQQSLKRNTINGKSQETIMRLRCLCIHSETLRPPGTAF